MRIRTILSIGMSLSCLAVAGCGKTSTPNVEAKAEPLTEAARADFKARIDKANDEEKAQQSLSASTETRARSVDEEEREQQRRNR